MNPIQDLTRVINDWGHTSTLEAMEDILTAAAKEEPEGSAKAAWLRAADHCRLAARILAGAGI